MASFLQIIRTKRYKIFISILYGWGASLVLVGALFKLEHWQGAGILLILGLGTEAIIFFFSAFEPLPGDYQWDRVFPELGEGENGKPSVAQQFPAQRRSQGAGIGLDFGLEPQDVENVKNSVRQFNRSMANLSVLAAITDTSNQFVEAMNSSANNMHHLNESIQAFSKAYRDTAQSFVENGEQSLNVLNRTLTAVNASYELYLQGHQKYVRQNDVLISSMQQYANQSDEMMDMMKLAGVHTRQFGSHMELLNQNIQHLNTIYGSMLTTVSSALKR